MAGKQRSGARSARFAVPLFLAGAIVVVGVVAAVADSPAPTGEKQRLIREAQQVVSKAEQGTAGPKPDPALSRPVLQPEPSWPAGIFADREAPMPAAEFAGVNRWQGEANGRRLTLYAGASGSDDKLGLVVLMSFSARSIDPKITRFEFRGEGAVKVVAESGSVVTLLSGAGRRYQFGAATGTLSLLP
jgi:hypothetical protein